MVRESVIKEMLLDTLTKIVGDTAEILYNSVCETYLVDPDAPKPNDFPKIGRGLVEVLKPYGEERLKLFLKGMRQIQLTIGDENLSNESREEILLYIGDMFLVLGEIPEALSHYFEVANIATKTDNKIFLSRALRRIGDVYSTKGEYDIAIEKYMDAKNIAESGNDAAGIAEALREIAEIEWKKGEYKLAKEKAKSALKFAENTEEPIIRSKIYITLARIYLYSGDNQVGLQYLNSALKIVQQIKDQFEICRIYNTFGVFYYTVEDYASASKYFKETMELAKTMGDLLTYTYGMINLASCYINLSNIEEAEKLVNEAIKLVAKLDNIYASAILQSVLGRLNAAKKNWEIAKSNFANAIKMMDTLGLQFNLAWTYIYIADMYLSKNEKGVAVTYLEKAEEIFSNLGNQYLAERMKKNIAALQGKS